jgi:ABC-2 type transport system ATP-binding protein
MKQRLGIAIALIGNPDFLILDEPINGLDPTGIVDVRELLLELKNQGKTIFISSHILGELEKIATRYGIISSGKLVEEITSAELSEKCGSRTVITVSDTSKSIEIISKMLDTGSENIECDKNNIFVKAKIDNIGELTNALFNAGVVVSGISNDENSAEKYFIRKMEGK